MEVRHLKLILASFMLLVLTPSLVQGINLGSSYKNDYVRIKTGESASFSILLWTIDKEPFRVALETTKVPDGWKVHVNPQRLVLSDNPDPPLEYINLNNGYLKVKPVEVFVNPPDGVGKGTYGINIKALAFKPAESEINIIQERSFNFKVDVVGFPTNSVKSVEEFYRSSEPYQDMSQAIKQNNQGFQYLPIIFFALILIVALIIYRHG